MPLPCGRCAVTVRLPWRHGRTAAAAASFLCVRCLDQEEHELFFLRGRGEFCNLDRLESHSVAGFVLVAVGIFGGS